MLQYFRPEPSAENINNEPHSVSDEECNRITYLIDKNDNEPYIKVTLKDISKPAAKNFGEMLYNVSNGFYQESVLKILVDFSKEDENINQFVLETIAHWYSLSKAYKKNTPGVIEKPWLKVPQVSPMDFNKYAK